MDGVTERNPTKEVEIGVDLQKDSRSDGSFRVGEGQSRTEEDYLPPKSRRRLCATKREGT